MSDLKPAKRFVAAAVRAPDKQHWYAQWAAPGWVPAYVLDGDKPQKFNSPGSAEIAAMKVLFSALNSRPQSVWQDRREFIGATALASELGEMNMSVSEFGHIIGSRSDRAQEMVAGSRTPPFFLWWALPMLRNPKLREFAKHQADQHTEKED